MDDDNGNGGGIAGGMGANPHISTELCAAYRETMKGEINKITSTIKLTALILGLILTSVQLAIHFLG